MIPERFLSRSIQLDEEDDFSMSPSAVLVAALPFFLLLLITFTIEVLPKDISIRLFDCLHQNREYRVASIRKTETSRSRIRPCQSRAPIIQQRHGHTDTRHAENKWI